MTVTDKPALLILSPGFPASDHDTTCLPPIQQFCRVASQEFPEVDLIVVAFQYPFRSGSYRWHGLEIHAAGGRNHGSVQRVLNWVKAWRIISRIEKERKLLGVLSLWLGETALVGKLYARLKKLPHYTWLQGQDARQNNRYVKLMRARGKELIALSDFTRTEVETHHGIRPFMVAPPGINEDAFPPLNTGIRDIDILGAGSLIPLKNYQTFVRVIFELKKQRPDIQALIAGAGPEERTLQELAFSLGLQHNLKFAGSVPHTEVLNLMNRSKVFLHPSTYEGLGVAMLEALFSGCQVVALRSPSPDKIANFTKCDSEHEMIMATKNNLNDPVPPQRILLYGMKETVHKIIGLFRGHQIGGLPPGR